MSYQELVAELKMQGKFFGITRVNYANSSGNKLSCVYKAFNQVAENEPVYLSAGTVACPGALTGLGFRDGIPKIPGGFGNFISYGSGPGFPQGERIKCSPEIAERMLLGQPQNVMGDFNAIKVALYNEGCGAELVTMLANPDQLSALFHLFYFRRSSYDDVIVPLVSGCAQIFRIPFGELDKPNPKAVLGNIDIFSRPHMEADVFALTVTGNTFTEMCENTEECFFHAHTWEGVKERLVNS